MKIATCSQPDCATPAKVRGYCKRHYDRALERNLIELRPKAKNGDGMRFLQDHVATNAEACVEWPFSRYQRGYGQLRFHGTSMNASRAMCILAHGEPPFPEAHAAHWCSNPCCVNPNHIRWATIVENHADKKIRGTQCEGETCGRSKLSKAQAQFALKSRLAAIDVAAQLGCTPANVRLIRRRKTWRSLDAVAA